MISDSIFFVRLGLAYQEISKKRKYSDQYISLGFTFTTERDGTQKPQCFLCGKVHADGSMKPLKLKDH